MKPDNQEPNKKSFLQRHDIFYLQLRMIRCALTEGRGEARRRYREYMHVHHPRPEGQSLSRQEKKRQKKAAFTEQPLFSIIVPLYNTPVRFLREMIRSVQGQTYAKWELCLADGSDDAHGYVGRICRWKARWDGRIKYQKLKSNGGISANSNAALDMAGGNYIGLLDHDDLLHPAALYEMACAIEKDRPDLLYTDEVVFQRRMKDADRFHFKPDYSPDTLRGNNYICHFQVFSRELLGKLKEGFRSAYDGSQDYDLTLRLTEKAERIVHIPKALYYWRDHSGSVASGVEAKPYTVEAGRRAIEDHLRRIGLAGEVQNAAFPSTYRVKYQIHGEPKISIVIPNKDHAEDLRKCIDSIREKSTWKNWEIIIVENNSEEEETFQTYQMLEKTDARIRTVRWKGAFNFSTVCNYGVSFASGEYILLLNNDTEVITPAWMEEMLMFAQRPDVGAVGSMLYYPDDTVQHAGVILGIGMAAAGHAHLGFPRGNSGYYARMSVACNLSAVTGACMMVPRNVYEEVGGLDEHFRVALNDIDFCLRIREKGYLIVFTPFAELYHYESRTRGTDLDHNSENRKRFEAEAAQFKARWADVLDRGDPYYNPNLTLEREDFRMMDEEEKRMRKAAKQKTA